MKTSIASRRAAQARPKPRIVDPEAQEDDDDDENDDGVDDDEDLSDIDE